MADIPELFFREQLLTRRRKLESAIAASSKPSNLTQLLNEVDSALDCMEAGTYGLCKACHEPVEKDRLIADPLIRYCLAHLTPDQQRAVERDLELASQIQRGLLPKRGLSYGGWETWYHYEPLGPVSGDYCDVVIHEDGSNNLFFALGDASGKGVAASMLMTQLHAIFRTLLATGLPVHALVEQASRIFCESTLSNFFATLVCGRANLSGEIELCNAGHCPALLIRGGEVTKLEATGVPLGMFCTGQYPSQRVQLAPEDTLFLYTDGISEARSAAGEEYGEARLSKVLERSPALPSQSLVRACIEDLTAFLGDTQLADDLTIMVIRRVG